MVPTCFLFMQWCCSLTTLEHWTLLFKIVLYSPNKGESRTPFSLSTSHKLIALNDMLALCKQAHDFLYIKVHRYTTNTCPCLPPDSLHVSVNIYFFLILRWNRGHFKVRTKLCFTWNTRTQINYMWNIMSLVVWFRSNLVIYQVV